MSENSEDELFDYEKSPQKSPVKQDDEGDEEIPLRKKTNY